MWALLLQSIANSARSKQVFSSACPCHVHLLTLRYCVLRLLAPRGEEVHNATEVVEHHFDEHLVVEGIDFSLSCDACLDEEGLREFVDDFPVFADTGMGFHAC